MLVWKSEAYGLNPNIILFSFPFISEKNLKIQGNILVNFKFGNQKLVYVENVKELEFGESKH